MGNALSGVSEFEEPVDISKIHYIKDIDYPIEWSTEVIIYVRLFLKRAKQVLGISNENIWNNYYIPLCINKKFVTLPSDEFIDLKDRAIVIVNDKSNKYQSICPTWFEYEVIVEIYNLLEINCPFNTKYVRAEMIAEEIYM